MSFETLGEVLEQEMIDNWPVANGNVAYENRRFDDSLKGKVWSMFTVITGGGFNYGIDGSGGVVRDTGLISLQIFVPEFSGARKKRKLIDSFNTIFENKKISGISTLASTSISLGTTAPGWDQTSVTIPYRRNR